jgi:hypothetical protein
MQVNRIVVDSLHSRSIVKMGSARIRIQFVVRDRGEKEKVKTRRVKWFLSWGGWVGQSDAEFEQHAKFIFKNPLFLSYRAWNMKE